MLVRSVTLYPKALKIYIPLRVVVYSPQLYENYVLQSGEGLSVAFVLIWLVGDLCNLSGAILAHLLPTVIILALYVSPPDLQVSRKIDEIYSSFKYSLCDLLLLLQIYYYRWKGSKAYSQERQQEERAPLLSENRGSQNIESGTKILLRYMGCLVFVFAVGVIAWWISSSMHQRPPEPPRDRSKSLTWAIQILGWTSAILFVSSGITSDTSAYHGNSWVQEFHRSVECMNVISMVQILTFRFLAKNFQTRCEGLTPALFFFAMFGNITYALSICAKSMEKSYLITNASWLAGMFSSRVQRPRALPTFFIHCNNNRT
jgi:solute carrier family 66 (lysosomal lysine-arginine transporter), member 1